MYKSQDVVPEAQEPQLGSNDSAGPTEWLPSFVDTLEASRALGIPEFKVWNARRAYDDIRTPGDETRALCDEIIWWHNQLGGYEITLADVRGPSRLAPIVSCRGDCMRRIRHVRGWSYPVIGKWFGGRDHSTAIHHIEKTQVATAKVSNRARLTISELRAKADHAIYRRKLRETRRAVGMAGVNTEGASNHENP